jgi:hypothetical protein
MSRIDDLNAGMDPDGAGFAADLLKRPGGYRGEN